jgi:hypothetical protein
MAPDLPCDDLRTVWYARVLLLLKFLVRTDEDMLAVTQDGLTVTKLELAFVEVMSSAVQPVSHNRYGRIMIYEPRPCQGVCHSV